MLAAVTLLLLHLLPAHGHSPAHNHDHIARNALPGTWFQPNDHAVRALFARDDFPPVGSDAWVASLPPFTPDGSHTPDITKLPQAWVDAYNAAKAAGNIPNIPQSTTGGQYPNNLDPKSTDICSSYIGCRSPEDHFNVPDGTLALNFDDGPTEFTGQLLDFLKTNNEIATHFVIGYSIQQNVSAWQLLLNSGHDLAAHTWSHHQLTTQSDMEVVSELGWSMNIIYLSTGGRVPRFWRPPTGDADNRIRAIAKYVFGMEMIVWNQDTEDWSLTETPPPTTTDVIAGQMKTWLNGPKSPGLMILEHELSDLSIGAFMAAYPLMKSAGWKTQSAARLVNTDGAYRNSPGPTGTVTAAGLLDFKGVGPSGATNSTGNTSSSGSASAVQPSGSVSGTGSKPASTGTSSNASSKNGSASASSSSSPAPTGGAIRLDIAWFNALVLGAGAVTYMML
ncbi:carbohydrate esterase family 4 protein [Mycena olivaceomarginata]|nr:carbohydrate esterase family 4 protein [Mycena olivaceomarginata]